MKKAEIIENGNVNLKPLMLTSPKEIEFKEKVTESIDIIQKQIRNQKEAIVKQKLKEIGMLKVLKDIHLARFPKLMVVMQGGKEIVYVDNKTLKGLKLVTFEMIDDPTIEGNEFKTKLFYY